eukprot:440867_1
MSNSTKTKVATVDSGVSEADTLFSQLSMTGIGSLYCDVDGKQREKQDIPAHSSRSSQLQNDTIDSDDESSTKDNSVKNTISKDCVLESSTKLNDSISEADFAGFDLSPLFMSTRGAESQLSEKGWSFSGPNFEKYDHIASGERAASLFGSSIITDKSKVIPGNLDVASTESDSEGSTCDDENSSDWSYERKICSGDGHSDASDFGLEFGSDGGGEMSPFVQGLIEYFKTGNNEETGSVEKFI